MFLNYVHTDNKCTTKKYLELSYRILQSPMNLVEVHVLIFSRKFLT